MVYSGLACSGKVETPPGCKLYRDPRQDSGPAITLSDTTLVSLAAVGGPDSASAETGNHKPYAYISWAETQLGCYQYFTPPAPGRLLPPDGKFRENRSGCIAAVPVESYPSALSLQPPNESRCAAVPAAPACCARAPPSDWLRLMKAPKVSKVQPLCLAAGCAAYAARTTFAASLKLQWQVAQDAAVLL
ncbi:hypothetical protein D9Q98_003840 [Chlorella vulgaris]|uniref:Uncharacterized protein n=1 Tax=Chlorella vulgaris TaxID=3077 RepID=A0A9D4YXU0_CHLVU|nr:hypothetical protein D9Q98_003840 [Chlorella vulgaris]